MISTECREKSFKAIQENAKIWINLEPVQSKVSSVVVMAAGVGVILALVETSAQVQLYHRHYSAL